MTTTLETRRESRRWIACTAVLLSLLAAGSCTVDGAWTAGDRVALHGDLPICADACGAPVAAAGTGASARAFALDDRDRDGVSDDLDHDIDGDGIPNARENAAGIDPMADGDGDGIANAIDADDRGDGVANQCDGGVVCARPGALFDQDGDGVANHLDIDSDGDGVLDLTEAGNDDLDHDLDGVVDGPVGENGLPDALESAPDSGELARPPLNTDAFMPGGDALCDFLDRDSDGDGWLDGDEVGALRALDSDGDGWLDDGVDEDGDGLVRAVDRDDSAFGYPSAVTSPRRDDRDRDRIPDAYDRDDARGQHGGDSDGDGLLDVFECWDWWPCPQLLGDGVPDYARANDGDGDGVGDRGDIDADDDGIPDRFENSLDLDPMVDNDLDGVPNYLDADDRGDGQPAACLDIDGDGLCNVLAPLFDVDGDQVPNHRDSDSDGDGIFDLHEAGHDLPDGSGDGRLGLPVAGNGLSVALAAEGGGLAYRVADSDGDGERDALDLDSDADSLSDADEAGDDDPHTPPVDSDGDGAADHCDSDADGDRIPDAIEAGTRRGRIADSDGDGVPDFRDLDADGDGVSDDDEAGPDGAAPLDSDGDGVFDFRDLDADGDRVPDARDNCHRVRNHAQRDSDGDGIGDACDASISDQPRYVLEGGGCATGSELHGDSRIAALLLIALALLGVRVRGGSRFYWLSVFTAVLALFSTAARAQSAERDSSYAVERFRLASDGAGILDVEGAAVPAHMRAEFGLWLGYTDDPLNVAAERPGQGSARVGSLVSERLGGALHASLGLWDRVQFGLAMEMVLAQGQDTGMLDGDGGALSGAGVSALHFTPKLQVLDESRHPVSVSVIAGLTLPVGSGEGYMNDGATTWAPELALARGFGEHVRGGLNLGYRARERQRTWNLDLDDELFARAGVGVRMSPALESYATFSYATPSGAPMAEMGRDYGELKGGVCWLRGNWTVFAAAGFGTQRGVGAPDWRALAGVRVARWLDLDAGPRTARRAASASASKADTDQVFENPLRLRGESVAGTERGPGGRPGAELGDGGDVDASDRDDDSDGDGISDAVDACPTQLEDLDGYVDTDGCPDLDNDEDGVRDYLDGCPDVAGVASEAGCPARDRDGDTVADYLDNCPDTPGYEVFHGCSEEPLALLTPEHIALTEAVAFDADRVRLRRHARRMFAEVAAILHAHPSLRLIQIEGYTDDRGDLEANLRISQHRAEIVRAFLIARGVAEHRLRAVGYGSARPIGDNRSERGRELNRRVELRILR